MDYILVSLASLGAAGLTFFSGFGLGSILLPVFTLFAPVTAAVALTAVVHFLNNCFKFALTGRHADKNVLIRFGLPAMAFSAVGAWSLTQLSHLQPLAVYTLSNKTFEIEPVKITTAALIAFFAILECWPGFEKRSLDPKYLPFGGALSGFLGGLSGHQGAFRSMCLIRCGLSKESFIGTGVTIACMVDMVRLTVYAKSGLTEVLSGRGALLSTAVIAAFAGSLLGNHFVKKMTLRGLQYMVSALLLLISAALAAGWI